MRLVSELDAFKYIFYKKCNPHIWQFQRIAICKSNERHVLCIYKTFVIFLVLSYLSPRYILGNTSSEILRQLAAWRSINKVQSVAMEYKWCSFVSSWKVRFEQFSTLYLHCRHLLMHFGECKKHLFKQIELSVLVPSRSLSLHILIDSLSELKDDLALYDSWWK